jgi:flagellar motor switch protein FliM
MANQKQSLLSSEEVEALVEGMATGDVDTTPAPGPAASAVQAYSLVSTDTTTRGQLAALEMINDRLSRQMRGSLLNLLRKAVKLAVNPFEVTTFGSFIQSVQAPCNVNIVRYPPLRGYGLVTIEPSLVYGAVDSFFGGSADGSQDMHPQRGFTPTEERIIQLLLEVVFNDLREAWAPVYALNPEYVSREINPAFVQVGEERETVVVSRFDLELGAGIRGQIAIMYPFSALKPIRLLLRGRMQSGERDEKLAHAWAEDLKDAVVDAELEVVAQLATLRVSALDLATIQPGDTLWFKPPESVKVLVQSNHLFDAEYGTQNNNMAVRIERVIEPIAPKAVAEVHMSGDDDESDEVPTRRASVGRAVKSAGVSAA